MDIKYQTFVDNNLLVIQYKGKFCIKKYKAHVLHMIATPEWKQITKVLTDLRFVNISSDVDTNIINDLIDIKINTIKRKHFSVQLVDNSLLTALVHLFQFDMNEKNFETEYCSSIKKAIELLELDMNEVEFELILDNLEQTF